MFSHTADTAIILGAGFSKSAGLPLASEMSQHMFDSSFSGVLDMAISSNIRTFLATTFGWEPRDPIPTFEDIFTMIDLAAASGHNLGRKSKPNILRALRRMLIFRIFSILDQRYADSPDIAQLLNNVITTPNTSHFIALNWDIVLENHLYHYIKNVRIDYCTDAKHWDGDVNPPTPAVEVAVVKIHGSANWVYCDNCRTLFYGRPGKLSLKICAGIEKHDFRLFDPSFTDKKFDKAVGISPRQRQCRVCQCAVGPHIATFSFKKSFRTHAFASSWLAAEQILTQAKKWLFIGYSLPAADYEFKHLLKSCELKERPTRCYPKDIEVVVNDRVSANNFSAFFGKRRVTVHDAGLADYV